MNEQWFSDFCSHATNPISIEVSDASKNFQLQLIRLQYDSILHNSSNQETLITFHASLLVPWFSELCKLAWNLASVFGSTYTCEQAFHVWNRTKFLSRITSVHLHDMMRSGTSKTENKHSLAEQRRPKFHINKVTLGYFYCNIQFHIGYSTDIWMLKPS
jgi:hypothetical protein